MWSLRTTLLIVVDLTAKQIQALVCREDINYGKNEKCSCIPVS